MKYLSANRVIAWMTRRGSHGDERGAAAPILAVMALGLLGVAALSVDLGNNWQEHRGLAIATDAAAIAAAQDFGDGIDGCANGAPALLTRNNPDAQMLSCVVGGDETLGWVTVSAEVVVDQMFAKTFGTDDVPVSQSSTAMFGTTTGGPGSGGLRPMGVCLDFLQAEAIYASWAVGDMETPSAPMRVPYTKSNPNVCGAGTPGNWGTIDFNGGSNGTTEIRNWIENGYDGEVPAGWYEGNPGALSNSVQSQLLGLIDDNVVFTLPIYTEASGNGANAQFHIEHFVTVSLTDFLVVGQESTRWIEVSFHGPISDTSGSAVVEQLPVRLVQLGADGQPIIATN